MDRNTSASRAYPLAWYTDSALSGDTREFVREEPLLIRVGESPYAVIMRTPGDEIAHAAGFCLSEGLVQSPDDIASIGYCSDLDENSITVGLAEERRKSVAGRLERQGYLSQTSCGICGRDMIDDLVANLRPVNNGSEVTYPQVFECMEKFTDAQEHYTRTRGTHAVMLFDSGLNIIAKAEDVGRHNAMDKSIGAVFLEERMSEVRLAVLSSRISFEMIQKAARAGISIIISKSNPTSMAVELSLKLNMTLISLDKKSGFVVPCGEKRVLAAQPSGR